MAKTETGELLKILSDYVYRTIKPLSENLNTSGSKANLAILRRGAGKTPGEMPELWGCFLRDLPEELMGTGSEPSKSEWAIYLALVMYALHQQGNDIPMNRVKDKNKNNTLNDSNDTSQQQKQKNDSSSEENCSNSLGTAVGKLIKTEEDAERIIRRFNVMATSADITELSHHLRTIISLLNSEKITLDYSKLAKDLYRYQSSSPNTRANVRLEWGRDFYRQIHIQLKDKDEENTTENRKENE